MVFYAFLATPRPSRLASFGGLFVLASLGTVLLNSGRVVGLASGVGVHECADNSTYLRRRISACGNPRMIDREIAGCYNLLTD